ncbi:class I SAM-dependent methyltransferase [Hyphomicrobium sp. LHD-15]|uniref:class I SAM-dependent methyltransferase n=1 Tax=Hyphomicrobium sp. LHD-15 TaxID=3072142 RepID=UPI00280F3E26|nr:class I SAM-dependent methyltransferase [Hyphomicrobium sp. LHD-15]MDQ8699692.1 class I SAM-dependent methyltransferase [Hyphomicrobium sp. LHD-15]
MTKLKEALEEQQRYYDDRAPEYDDWWFRRGMFDEGPAANARWFAEAGVVSDALQALDLDGDVLELAAGTGIWSGLLVPRARTLTLVDGSAQMLAHNPAARDGKVRTVIADLFQWRPDRSFDVVVFAFWISHVPSELLADFLADVAAWLNPGGSVFFVDNLGKPEETAPHVLGKDGQFTRRRLADGRQATVVKNYYSRTDLQAKCLAAGLTVEVLETPTLFQYGIGRKT